MEEKNQVGRLLDCHPLKRLYHSNKEYYDHQLGKEDSPKSHRGLYPQLRQSCDFFANLLPRGGLHILDIGARDGAATDYFIQLGHLTAGIELSQKLVRRCQSHGIPVVQGDMHHLPFLEDSFDAIFAKDVLEHSYDPHLALVEWARTLKIGGIMYIECPCLGYNYDFHSYEFNSPEMLRQVVKKVLDADIIRERQYYTVQVMYCCIVRLRSKKTHYFEGPLNMGLVGLWAGLRRRIYERSMSEKNRCAMRLK
jgi:SAM-dependent methyltransferase